MIYIKWKKYWGVIPIVVFLVVKIIAAFIGSFTEAVLRSIPQMIMSCFGAVSIYILVFWTGKILLWQNRENPSLRIRIIRKVLSAVYCVAVVVTMGIGMFFSVFSYHPEYIVERNR